MTGEKESDSLNSEREEKAIHLLSQREWKEIGREIKMCMDKSAVPAKKIWLAIAARLGLRPTAGLRNLRKEVRTCEYRDVHIMWEMLREMGSPVPLEKKEAAAAAAVAAAAGARKKKKAWRRFVYYCCAF